MELVSIDPPTDFADARVWYGSDDDDNDDDDHADGEAEPLRRGLRKLQEGIHRHLLCELQDDDDARRFLCLCYCCWSSLLWILLCTVVIFVWYVSIDSPTTNHSTGPWMPVCARNQRHSHILPANLIDRRCFVQINCSETVSDIQGKVKSYGLGGFWNLLLLLLASVCRHEWE